MKPLNVSWFFISIGIGASCLIWGKYFNNIYQTFSLGFVIKLVPLRLFGKIAINETPMTDEEEARSLVTTLRKSHRQSVRQSARAVQEHNQRESQRVSGRLSRGVNFPRESNRN